MKAARVEAFGDASQLAIVDVPEPVPGEGELVIEIHAAGLNYADLMQREGLYLGGPRPPYVPGVEAAGVVIAHGPGVTAPAIGERVMVTGRGGLHAERAAVPATSCVVLPAQLDFVAGAAFPVSFLTAYHALTTVARAQRGELVVIHAAGGSLGLAAVQIATLLGLHVLATASSQAKRDKARALGADVAVDYAELEIAARQLGGAAIVLESIGGELMKRSLAVLRPLGRLVLVGISSNQAPTIDPIKLLFKSQAVLGLHLDAIVRRPDLLEPSLAWLLARVVAGELAIEVGHTLPLAEIRRAHELLASRERIGKIVLTR